MGRYFNDDMLEEQNEDYDAYIEHYGIPKDKWNPQVRARYEQLHHKTADTLRKVGIGHDNRSGFQKAGDYFTKKKVRGVGFNRKKGLYLKRSIDFQNDIHNTARKANTLPRPSQKFIRKMGGSSKTFTDFYGKKRVRGITVGKNGIHLKRTTDFQNAVEKTGKSIKKAYTDYNKGAQRIVAYNRKRYGSKPRTKAGKNLIKGFDRASEAINSAANYVTGRKPAKSRSKSSYSSISDTVRKTARKAGSTIKSAANRAGKAASREFRHAKWDVNHAINRRNVRPDRTQADYERDKQLRSNLRQTVSRGTQAANANAERAQRERNRRRYGLNTADQERRKGLAANRRRARRNTV